MKIIKVKCKDDAKSVNNLGNKIKTEVQQIFKYVDEAKKLLDDIFKDDEAKEEIKKMRVSLVRDFASASADLERSAEDISDAF